MRRRDFLALFGAATGGWSVRVHGQQSAKKHLIGFLGPSSLSLERRQVAAFLDRLRELGHIEGATLAVEYAWAEGHDDRLPVLAEELVRLQPDVIVTTGTPGTLAAKRATSNIPIVFASSGNPITAGLVQSLSRPGGNVTGMT
jgi:putative tryptophan/tyrosine transport system substrate-binding protein